MAGDGCTGCSACADACPVNAIDVTETWTIDLGRCIFCFGCIDACGTGALAAADSPDYALDRGDLVIKRGDVPKEPGRLDIKLGRSVFIRQVDTGSCNACEAEINSLSNQFYDFERFGIRIVASPRHADVLLVTGPLTENMYEAFLNVKDAVPDPKVVIAMGSCAISGGMFKNGSVVGEGIADADMYVPGCPSSPDRLMRALVSAFLTAPR